MDIGSFNTFLLIQIIFIFYHKCELNYSLHLTFLNEMETEKFFENCAVF